MISRTGSSTSTTALSTSTATSRRTTFVASGCGTAHPSVGCYGNAGSANFYGLPLGPNGYAVEPGYFGLVPSIADREAVANVHIAVPHAHDGLKDDVQLLYNPGVAYNTPNDAMGDWGAALVTFSTLARFIPKV